MLLLYMFRVGSVPGPKRRRRRKSLVSAIQHALNHHLSTYIIIQERQEGAVLVCDWSWIWQALLHTKLSFEPREQTTSSFHLRWKCYLRI